MELDFSQIAALSAIGANRSTSNSKKQPQIQHQSTTDSHLQQALPHSLNGQSKPVSVLPKPPISQPASQTKPTPVKSRPMPEPESPTRMIPPQVRTSLPTATRVLASVSPPPITPKPAHSLPNGNGNHHQQAPETPEKDKSPRKKKGKAAKEPQKPSPVVTPPIAPTVSSGISQTNGTQPIQQSLLATLLPRSQNNGSLPRDRKKFGAAVRAMMQVCRHLQYLINSNNAANRTRCSSTSFGTTTGRNCEKVQLRCNSYSVLQIALFHNCISFEEEKATDCSFKIMKNEE